MSNYIVDVRSHISDQNHKPSSQSNRANHWPDNNGDSHRHEYRDIYGQLINDLYNLFKFEIIVVTFIFILALITKNKILFTICIIVIIFLAYFARSYHGNFHLSANTDQILSPADGKISNIIKSDKFVSVHIFLNLHNIHKQYIPIDGKVIYIKKTKGHFKKAYLPMANLKNTKITTVLQTKIGFVVIEQVSGFLVRKIISYVKPNQTVRVGMPLGFIKFGSLVTITMPANKVEIIKNKDDNITIGEPLTRGRRPSPLGPPSTERGEVTPPPLDPPLRSGGGSHPSTERRGKSPIYGARGSHHCLLGFD